MKKQIKLCVILPAYNEGEVIADVLDGVKREVQKIENIKVKLVVIDDGSTDKTALIAEKKGAEVLKHIINRGLGGALKTGLEYAKLKNQDMVVTMDSDGQHNPGDIKKLINPIINKKADVVIGIRQKKLMPWDRKIITWFSSWLTFFFFKIYFSDTQSGFRVFNKKAIQNIKLKTQQMEVSSEFFAEIKKHRLRLKELPIKVIYTQYSRAKGQKNLNAFNVLLKLVLRLGR